MGCAEASFKFRRQDKKEEQKIEKRESNGCNGRQCARDRFRFLRFYSFPKRKSFFLFSSGFKVRIYCLAAIKEEKFVGLAKIKTIFLLKLQSIERQMIFHLHHNQVERFNKNNKTYFQKWLIFCLDFFVDRQTQGVRIVHQPKRGKKMLDFFFV